MPLPRRLLFAATVPMILGARLGAQTLALPTHPPIDTTVAVRAVSAPASDSARVVVGAPIDGDRVAAHRAETNTTKSLIMARSGPGLGEARAMMIVGGAALIVGSFIDGTTGRIVMVGGAVVGLIGLYEYLQ